MKTIRQIVTEIKAAGFRLSEQESTWAESKWWFEWPHRARAYYDPEDIPRAMLALRRIKANVGRPIQFEQQTEEMDSFRGVFVSFPKNAKAKELIDAGLDPGDLEHD